MRLPRLIRRFGAQITGYFWLPCPVCGESFAGFERGNGRLLRGFTYASLTCPKCPGFWIRYDDDDVCYQLEPRIDERGEIQYMLVLR